MRFDVKALAFAAGTAAAAAFTACAIAVAVAPGATTAFLGFITHTDLSTLSRPLTWASFAGGVIAWWAIVAALFGLAASLYNRFAGAGLPMPSDARPVDQRG